MSDATDLGPLDATRWDERFVERLSELIPYDADQLLSYVAKESNRQALDYIKDDGEGIIIPITPAPVRFTARQVSGLRDAFEVLAGAVTKVAAAWLDSTSVQAVLPLTPYEAEWLRLAREAPG